MLSSLVKVISANLSRECSIILGVELHSWFFIMSVNCLLSVFLRHSCWKTGWFRQRAGGGLHHLPIFTPNQFRPWNGRAYCSDQVCKKKCMLIVHHPYPTKKNMHNKINRKKSCTCWKSPAGGPLPTASQQRVATAARASMSDTEERKLRTQWTRLFFVFCLFFVFLSLVAWQSTAAPRVSTCPTTLLLNCKGPDQDAALCGWLRAVHSLVTQCHTVTFNYQCACTISRVYDEKEVCSSTQFWFQGRLAMSHGQQHKRNTPKHNEVRATTLSEDQGGSQTQPTKHKRHRQKRVEPSSLAMDWLFLCW